MKTIMVEVLDKNKIAEINDAIDSIKNLAPGLKVLNFELNSTVGDYNDVFRIVTKALTHGIKVNATCSGNNNVIAPIILTLARQTGGSSSAFFGSKFHVMEKVEKGKSFDGIELSNASIFKALLHLKCKASVLKEIYQSREVISSETAKKCGMINEIINFPALPKKLAKKGQKTGKKLNSTSINNSSASSLVNSSAISATDDISNAVANSIGKDEQSLSEKVSDSGNDESNDKKE